MNKAAWLIATVLVMVSPFADNGAFYPQHGGRQDNAYHESAVKKPNMLWLVAEDMSPYLAAFGDSTASTPNLDQLAREGVRFTHCFDVSGVCAPSRSALITGMYPTAIGTHNMRTSSILPEVGLPGYSAVLPEGVKMFSERMRAGGYYCTNNAKEDYQFRAPRSGWDESSKTAHWKNRPEGKPFFAVFNLDVTHESRIWMKKDDPLLVDPASVPLPPYFPESPIIRKDMARMYSNIMEMDAQVGVLLKELREDGLLDNTIIMWFSDNGGPMARSKREIYDSGIRIPLIVRYPDKKGAGSVDSQMISFVDFAPTVLELAGIPMSPIMHGTPFLGKGSRDADRQFVFAARDRMDSEYDMVRAVRSRRYKYIRNFQPEKPYMQNIRYRKQMDLMNELLRLEKEGTLNEVQRLWFRKTKSAEELYDTWNDPFELHNIADNPALQSIKLAHREALDNWMKYTEDKGMMTEAEMLETMWPGKKQPTTDQPVFLDDGLLRISSPTAGASISWQLIKKNDSIKEKRWQVYTGPLKVLPGERIVAVAERIGFKSSEFVFYDKVQ